MVGSGTYILLRLGYKEIEFENKNVLIDYYYKRICIYDEDGHKETFDYDENTTMVINTVNNYMCIKGFITDITRVEFANEQLFICYEEYPEMQCTTMNVDRTIFIEKQPKAIKELTKEMLDIANEIYNLL